jgi:hypothetical protein
MSYGIAGSSPFADLTKTIEDLVRAMLFAQWSLTVPGKDSDAEKAAPNKVRFGLGWSKGIRNIHEIHCIHMSTIKEVAANGWKLHMFRTVIDVHVFVKRSTEGEPDNLRKMLQEIDRIVAQNRLSLGEGVGPMRLTGWQQADDPETIGDVSYWHRVGQVECWYWKTDTL